MSDQSSPYSPKRLADRAEIQDAICRWCRGVDRLDYEAVRSAFHPDAIDHSGSYEGGVDGLIDWIRERHQTIPFSMHFVGNMLIEFNGPDEAVVETYCIAFQRFPVASRAALLALVGEMKSSDDTASDLIAAARYVDRFTRRQGHWRIQARTVVFDSTMLIEAPAEEASGGAFERGRRDREDSIYGYLARRGIGGSF